MAVKWAVANGNWSAGATWNDGVVPADGDDVYANNYEIIMNVSTINIGSINTTEYPDYNIARGGQFIFNTTRIFQAERTCDLRYSSGVSILYNGSNADCYFTAPLIKSNGMGVFSHMNGSSKGWNVNGDIEIDNPNTYLAYAGAGSNRHLLNINGNINGAFIYSLFSNSNTGGWNITINGNVLGGHEDCTTNLGVSNITINGHKHYTLNEYDKFAKGQFVINGNITYEANNEKAGLDLAYTSIQNPSTFTWKDVTSPRANHFVVITDIELNNSLQYPPEDKVKEGTEYAWGVMTGEWIPDYPQEENVKMGVSYADGELVGTYDFNQYLPPESVVLKDYEYGDSGDRKTGTLSPVVLGDYPAEADVKVGVVFDYGNKVGTFQPTADYPAEADVLQGVEYAYGQMTGTLSVATDYPQEANVLLGVEYANGSMVGTLEVVQMQADYPSEDDVRFDIPFDFGNKLGKCHVPIPEDVRDGVPVDVNEVGTLIPSSGGDRLRIADFGYYTNAQSDTYIVDLTEQDKPKFAVAEERVLIEMFPDLDLENIPDKYFDDLFVKYLKYRLIVEYYRTAGINSTFTPSEPTTEIVNYQNVRNEVWLNSANIYLKAWAKKYPESITKPQRILL